MKAFVTGATGFVGMWVTRMLLEAGCEVRVLARRMSDRRNLVGLDVEVVEGNLRDQELLSRALDGCEELYHVAALYSTREEDAPHMYEVNVGGTKAILRAARRAGVRRIVYTSTIGTIGRPVDGSLPTEENDFNLWETSSHYARSKYLAEMVAISMAREGLPVVIVNPCAPIGAGDLKPSSTGQRIVDYLSGRVPSFVAGGINFISVKDVAAGHLLAAQRGVPGRRYILGHLQGNLTREGFYHLMERASGVRPPPSPRKITLLSQRSRWSGSRQPAALTCCPLRAVEELGLPQSSLEEAAREAVEWFRTHGYVRRENSRR